MLLRICGAPAFVEVYQSLLSSVVEMSISAPGASM